MSMATTHLDSEPPLRLTSLTPTSTISIMATTTNTVIDGHSHSLKSTSNPYTPLTDPSLLPSSSSHPTILPLSPSALFLHQSDKLVPPGAAVISSQSLKQDDESLDGFANDQDFISHILRTNDSRLDPFLKLGSQKLSSSQHPSSKFMAIWRLVDPRKPNRHRRLLERTQTKLQTSTFKQVHQILILNGLLDTLKNYNLTCRRFQSNSLELHRCLIKWDRLKSRDEAFSRTSLKISLDLQRFMTRITAYYPTTYAALAAEHLHGSDDQPDDEEDEDEEEQEQEQDEMFSHDSHTLGAAVGDEEAHQPTTPVVTKKLSLHTHLLIRYRLHQLRSNARRFNRQFRQHEDQKTELKLQGNQCIFNMVKDGKVLLEINEILVKLVLDLVLMRQ